MKAISLIVSLFLFFGGVYALSIANVIYGAQGVVFIGGILMICAAFAIPVHVLQKFD